jgi:hypothetical protein
VRRRRFRRNQFTGGAPAGLAYGVGRGVGIGARALGSLLRRHPIATAAAGVGAASGLGGGIAAALKGGGALLGALAQVLPAVALGYGALSAAQMFGKKGGKKGGKKALPTRRRVGRMRAFVRAATGEGGRFPITKYLGKRVGRRYLRREGEVSRAPLSYSFVPMVRNPRRRKRNPYIVYASQKGMEPRTIEVLAEKRGSLSHILRQMRSARGSIGPGQMFVAALPRPGGVGAVPIAYVRGGKVTRTKMWPKRELAFRRNVARYACPPSMRGKRVNPYLVYASRALGPEAVMSTPGTGRKALASMVRKVRSFGKKAILPATIYATSEAGESLFSPPPKQSTLHVGHIAAMVGAGPPRFLKGPRYPWLVGRKKNPEVMTLTNPANREGAKALAAFRKFHGTNPGEVVKVRLPAGWKGPKVLVGMGEANAIEYRPNWPSERRHRERWRHTYKRGGTILAATPDGRFHAPLPVAGKKGARVKWTHGIVG